MPLKIPTYMHSQVSNSSPKCSLTLTICKTFHFITLKNSRFSSCYLVVASLKFPFFWAIHVLSDPIHNIMISKSVFSWIFTNTFPLGGQFINFLTFQKWSAQLSGNISWFQSQLYVNYFHFSMVICYCWVLTIWPNIPDCFLGNIK